MLATTESNQSQHTQEPQSNEESDSSNNKVKKEDKKYKIAHSLIEQCVGQFRRRRSHQNPKDFGRKYLKDIFFMKNVLKEM